EDIVHVTSHDLRSPLVNIQGFSNELRLTCDTLKEVLDKEQLPDEKKEDLDSLLGQDIPEALSYILAGTEKMDRLLKGLLQLSRLGRASLNMELIDMDQMVNEIKKSMEFQVKETGAQVEVGDLPTCRGDAVRMSQVFSNLLDNALKYLDQNRAGVIRIGGRVEGNLAVYWVEDNGVGIAQEHQDKAFEIFHRLDLSMGTGEGLGLTIARRVVSRHNGQIWIESERGQGSRFFVSLPTV
ncbi:MAG: GHKL domain-containing protein, partial [Candidatus Latescibacteria bacterium]|nr:GHKL domain-containing protein [Candidatus Latescibacterota bacterium]